nr:AAA family ATPase [uncultured Blautia sp.]
MKTCRQLALEWGVSERTVNNLCKKGKIDGAVKEGRSWLIPDDARKPADGRVSYGKYIKRSETKELKPLPIGISDYVRAQAEYYYVDKTMLIKDFLDQKPMVSLFTRPRRFGKTLNMDMLRVFFEISEDDTSKYFTDKAIWKCGEEYRTQQGIYPVVFLTFKDVKFDTWEATIHKIRGLLQEEYGRHPELASSDKIADYEKEYFQKVLNGTASEVDLTSALEKLSKMLAVHYKKAPIIIIDEYDTPIQEGYSKDFYDEIIGFMRNFFSGAFKDNRNLSYGFLTGILRIAQESIFSGLNNLTVNSVMDEEYDNYFGFTQGEVKEMLEYYGMSEKESELKEWYDGYLFGSEEIYNPWSVINYIAKGGIPQAYWVNTGKNEILEDVLKIATDDITERLYALLQGEMVVARIDQNVVYRSLAEDPANIYSLLLIAGYLKIPRKELQADGTYLCEVSIPNREIAAVYKNEILSHLLQIGAVTRTTANRIAESLYTNDHKKLQNAIAEYMDKSISFYDAGAEGFYHGLVLGLIALMDNQYKIKSNRESGDGRYDISLFPREEKYPGIIMELKWKKNLSADDLDGLAEEAFDQIEKMRYDSEMKENGVQDILKFGIAFSGKKVSVKIK